MSNFIRVLLIALASFSVAGYVQAKVSSLLTLNPLTDVELMEYRGGFGVANDYVVNIGLSVVTSINGNTIFNSHIADLVIRNGQIISSGIADSGVNVVQVGENNQVVPTESTENSLPVVESETTQPSNIESIDSTPVVSHLAVNQGATLLSHVVQNTQNDSVIGLNTVVDIDSQVSGALRDLRANLRLQEALQMQLY